MRFKKERIFSYPHETVVSYFLEGEETGYDMSDLDNVTQWKIVREEDQDDKRVGTKEWCAHAQIPKTLQHIVSPKMLTWLEHSVWDRKNTVYSFKIEPFFFKRKVKCQGQTRYEPAGEGKCKRTFNVELKVSIPVAGPIFEKLVMELLKKNEDKDFELCNKALKKEFG